MEVLQWRESWPLLIVAVGINIVLRAMSGADKPRALAPDGPVQDEGRDEPGGAS
jgi:hypothetical protein